MTKLIELSMETPTSSYVGIRSGTWSISKGHHFAKTWKSIHGCMRKSTWRSWAKGSSLISISSWLCKKMDWLSMGSISSKSYARRIWFWSPLMCTSSTFTIWTSWTAETTTFSNRKAAQRNISVFHVHGFVDQDVGGNSSVILPTWNLPSKKEHTNRVVYFVLILLE